MTPAQAALKLNRMADRLGRECGKAMDRTSQKGVQIGKGLSKGWLGLAQLASMGHPYAVRHPQGTRQTLDPSVINFQSGRFYVSWKADAPRSDFSGGLRAAVINDSPEAGFLAGRKRPKSRMVRRPIDDAVRDRLRPVFFVAVRKAVRRALK